MERKKILELREKEIEEIKKIDAIDILRDLGAKIVKDGNSYILAHAPYRADRDASLNYFRNSRGHWIWKDMATGESGTHIDMIMKTYNYNYVEAVKYLRESYLYHNTHIYTQQKDRNETNNEASKEKEKVEWQVVDIKEMELSEQHRKALERERGYKDIPQTIKTYLATIRKNQDEYKKQYGYGIRDINGNAIVRVKKQDDGTYTNEKRNWKINNDISISHINNKKNKAIVIEGLHDYIAAYQKYKNDVDYIVLNSVNNVDKAIEYLNKSNYNSILVALDNDEAGKNATQKIISNLNLNNIYVARYNAKDLDELYRKTGQINLQAEKVEAAREKKKKGIELSR